MRRCGARNFIGEAGTLIVNIIYVGKRMWQGSHLMEIENYFLTLIVSVAFSLSRIGAHLFSLEL